MKQPPIIIVQFIHMEGPLKGQIQEFNQPEIFIGRSASCHVCFPKDLAIVSRVHARVFRDGNRFILMDQSTNGTFVNGKLIKEAILRDGDILLFAEGGPKVSFLTQTMEASAAPEEQVSQPSVPIVPPMASKPQPPPMSGPPPISPPMAEPRPISPPERPAMIPPPVRQAPPISTPPPQAAQVGDLPIVQIKKPLVIQYGPTLQSFNTLPVTIGRDIHCDFKIDHPSLYERHAQVFFYQEQYWIKDLTGRGVVQINGLSVEGQGRLDTDYQLSLSPQGPNFRFLGGGRLAEIEPLAPEAPAAGTASNGGVSPGADDSQGHAVKQLGLMMKKILKR